MSDHIVISESRNTVEGFAERTLHNLRKTRQHGSEFHIVTSVACSLLGLIVFPFERSKSKQGYSSFTISDVRLSDLTRTHGWPAWSQDINVCQTLEQLIENMRHAVAHGNVKFSSDSRNLDEVTLTFENFYKEELKWIGSMKGDDLFVFCEKLSQYLIGRVG